MVFVSNEKDPNIPEALGAEDIAREGTLTEMTEGARGANLQGALGRREEERRERERREVAARRCTACMMGRMR